MALPRIVSCQSRAHGQVRPCFLRQSPFDVHTQIRILDADGCQHTLAVGRRQLTGGPVEQFGGVEGGLHRVAGRFQAGPTWR